MKLYAAAEQGHGEIVAGLVAAGADINAAKENGATPLFIAAQRGHGEIVSGLVAARADINAATRRGWTPLFIAAHNGHGEIVSGLVAAGADVNAAFQDGFTPLHITAQQGHGEILSGLVAAGADVKAGRRDGETPLHIAAQQGHGEIVAGLVAAGADVNAAVQHGATPLHIAAQQGHGEIVSGLVAAGADVNAAVQGGFTPLFDAAQQGHFDAVLALLVGGSCALSSEQSKLVDWRLNSTVRAVLHTPPPAAPLVAAQLRLAWSTLCHDRLGARCLLEFVPIDVVARVGHFVGIAVVYRARLRQAKLIHEFRTSTSVDSDDVARVCLVDAGWDATVAAGRFLTGVPEGVPAQGVAPAAPTLEGQQVEVLNEGLKGMCIKHLVEEGRLRIRLDGDASKTVWRPADCCALSSTG